MHNDLDQLVEVRDLAVDQVSRGSALGTEVSLFVSMEIVRCHSHSKVDQT